MYGNGSTTQLYAMVSPSGSYTTWTDVGIADSHICAIEKTTSGAFCWGSNFYAGMGVVSTTSGSNTPCAINSTYTWGPNAAATSTANSGCPIALSVSDFPIDNGGITTCGVTAMGKAYCWGDGSQRQIGNGTSTNINTAIQLVSGGYTWKMVDSGGDTNCGVTTAGVGYCWGRGDKGEVGNGTSGAYNYKSTPVLVSGGHTWKKIGLNSDSIDTTYGAPVCGITMAGALYCWGDNTNGKLGDGTTTQRTTPVAVSGGGTWADVAPGTDHTCGLKTDGSVWCWGLNTSGQLGNGTTTSSSVPVRESSNSSWKQVWAGYDATCGVKSDDTAWCWGNGTNSKLGNGTSTNKTSPTIVSGGHTWTMVSVGRYAMCGVRKTDSLIMCAGVATWGQLGRGTTAGTQSTPVVISDTNTYTSVSVGYYEDVCATRTDKTGWCWGGNGMGEGARGNQTRATVATAMQGCTLWGYDAAAMTETSSAPGCGAAVVPMKSLTAGGANSCGVTASGNGYCWGYNGDGQLGISGDTTDKLVPTAVTGGAVWSGIDAGDSMTCGIKTADQSAWCWGVGALGDGAGWQAGTSVAKQVSGGATWSKVVGGTEVACGIKSDGTLWCWGNRFGGLLGTGSTSGYNTVPTEVTGGGTWIDVAMGTCGIKTDGTLWCWGGVNGATTPTLFDSGSWIKIASGEVHTCGIKTGGAAYCWGDGYHGTLGDGNLAAHTASTPVAVLGGNTFTDISLFQYGTCGLTSTGTIKCWGIGAYGERGYGGTSQTATPTAISGTDTFTAVDAGWRHVCGLKTDKTAMCWGASGDGTTGYGAIGDGALVNRLTPVTVSGGNVFK